MISLIIFQVFSCSSLAPSSIIFLKKEWLLKWTLKPAEIVVETYP